MSDLVERFENLKKEIDKTKSLHITLKAQSEKEEQILRGIVKEIKEHGFDPKTLKQDLEKLEQDIDAEITAKEKEISEIKETLLKIKDNVKSHEAI